MTQYIIDTLAIVTTILLLVFSLFLITLNRTKKISLVLLALFLFSNALYLIDFLLPVLDGAFNIDTSSINGIGFSFGFLFGPLLYLYTRSVTVKEFKYGKKLSVHFLLFGIMFFIKLFHLNFVLSFEYPLLHAQTFPYMIACIVAIMNYREEIKKFYSAIENLNLTWLLYVVGAFFLMWMIDLLNFLLYTFTDVGITILSILTLLSITINFVFSILIFFKAIRNPEVFSDIYETVKTIKYEQSRLTQSEKQEYTAMLRKYFKQYQPYLNPRLSINDVAKQVGIPVKDLSQIINESLQKNFYDFINSYRIDDAKQMLLSEKGDKKTVLEILYEVGFNSKSAFNTAFRKYTGYTPTEFRHQKLPSN
jgi:AraC-like DNA-binding protein